MTSLPRPEWLSQFEEFLKCISCSKTIMDYPVFRCASEHLLCEACHMKKGLIKCPNCWEIMNRRSVMAENIVKKLPKSKCLFETCSFARADTQVVENHQATCVHRPILCYTCYESVPVSGMKSHLLTVHESQTWTVRCGQILNVNYPTWSGHGTIFSDPVTLQLNDGLTCDFYLNMTAEQGRYLFWVTHTWTRNDSNDQLYKYTVTLNVLKKGGASGMAIGSFTGFCTSHDCHPTSTKKSMFCLVVPEDVVEKATNAEGRFELNTTISQA